MSELFKAHRQWAERPADERFWTLADMEGQADVYRRSSTEREVPWAEFRAASNDAGDIVIRTARGEAVPTHYAFSQICARAGMSAESMRKVPAHLAAPCINYGFDSADREGNAICLLRAGTDGASLHAATTQIYSRIWNSQILGVVRRLAEDYGWKNPPARPALPNQPGTRLATEEDVRGCRTIVKPGDQIAPAGLYLSDHDMFAYLVNNDRPIDDGTDGGLGRGLFISNSEVGAGSVSVTTFFYRWTCSNHIVWDASKVNRTRLVHKGNLDMFKVTKLIRESMIDALSADSTPYVRKIQAAKALVLGKDVEDVVKTLYKQRIQNLGQKVLRAAIGLGVEDAVRWNYEPLSAWAAVQGITEFSQTLDAHGDERLALDTAAAAVLQLAA